MGAATRGEEEHHPKEARYIIPLRTSVRTTLAEEVGVSALRFGVHAQPAKPTPLEAREKKMRTCQRKRECR